MRLRSVTLTTGLVLAATALVVVPSPAQAAALTSAAVTASRAVNEVGPATCTVGGSSNSNASAPFTSDGVTVTQTATGTTTLVDTGDAGDTGSMTTTATAKARATESGGQLRTVDVDATYTGSVTYAQGIGTDCDTQAQLASQFVFETVLSAPRWVTVEAKLPPGATLQVVFQRTLPVSPPTNQIIVLIGTGKGRVEAETLLPAGTYVSQGVLATNFSSPTATGDPTSFSYTPHVQLAFNDVGTAKAAAAGDGTKYASLKNAVDCASQRLKGKFSKAAGTKTKPTIKKAIFKVNGTKSKTIKKVKKGTKITLKNLPADQDVSVTAVFKLVGGGKASFTRDYRACS